MTKSMEVVLYGAQRCNKTVHYQEFLKQLDVDVTFKDVEESENAAIELVQLYQTRKLNFPTIMIGTKKLRNPSDSELKKWLVKLGYMKLDADYMVDHNQHEKQFVLNLGNGEIATIKYQIREGEMYLVDALVPFESRGKGIGEELVLKTFDQLAKENKKAIAVCSYIKSVVEKHPEWKSIIKYNKCQE